MKEHPILFSGSMVRAILDGRKTMTRRVVRPQPEPCPGWDWSWPVPGKRVTPGTLTCWRDDRLPDLERYSPYGQPGDRLWVRETWAPADGRYSMVPVLYRADGDAQPVLDDRWRPSIYLPRWASRITLEVTGVRVERLQAITEEDARAEGVGDREDFGRLWDEINGDRAPWLSNPWVWVVSFRREGGAR